MIGLELQDTGAVAVAVSADGGVVARADGAGASLAASAAAALERVNAGPDAPIGVAAQNPDAPECAAVLHALASQRRGSFLGTAVASSGTAAAVAEAWIGAARGARDIVFFAVAEHASAGIVRDGAASIGAHRRAPAVAWLALNPVEREDYRRIGCLEAEVAAQGIVRRIVWRIKAGDRSAIQDAVGGDLGAITIDHVLDAARQGDGVAISVVRDTAKYLGMAAANLVVIADPAVLVVGGIMASAADLLLEPLRTELARRVPSTMMRTLTIAPGALGADAPAIGAARLANAAIQ